MFYLPITGTFARKRGGPGNRDWFYRFSRFDRFMMTEGYQRVDQDRDPNRPDKGFWSGDLGGTLTQRVWPWTDHLSAWRVAGNKVMDFLIARADDFKKDGLLIVTHSHGGHVLIEGLMTLGYVLPFLIDVIDIDMPIQRSVAYNRDKYLNAAATTHWLHVYSGKGLRDLWRTRYRWLGNRAGSLKMPFTLNYGPVEGGHSGILGDDGDYIHQLYDIIATVKARRQSEEHLRKF